MESMNSPKAEGRRFQEEFHSAFRLRPALMRPLIPVLRFSARWYKNGSKYFASECRVKSAFLIQETAGSMMLIWLPGKAISPRACSLPLAQGGMMESLAVPERIESLPFH